MRLLLSSLAGAAVLVGLVIAGPPAARPKTYLAVIDFASDQGKYGVRLADSVRLRMARHDQYDVVDHLTTAEHTAPLPTTADRKKLIDLMTNTLAVNMCIYGSVTKRGPVIRADICLLDLRDR